MLKIDRSHKQLDVLADLVIFPVPSRGPIRRDNHYAVIRPRKFGCDQRSRHFGDVPRKLQRCVLQTNMTLLTEREEPLERCPPEETDTRWLDKSELAAEMRICTELYYAAAWCGIVRFTSRRAFHGGQEVEARSYKISYRLDRNTNVVA